MNDYISLILLVIYNIKLINFNITTHVDFEYIILFLMNKSYFMY
jgi:hypothetical protein